MKTILLLLITSVCFGQKLTIRNSDSVVFSSRIILYTDLVEGDRGYTEVYGGIKLNLSDSTFSIIGDTSKALLSAFRVIDEKNDEINRLHEQLNICISEAQGLVNDGRKLSENMLLELSRRNPRLFITPNSAYSENTPNAGYIGRAKFKKFYGRASK